jgi:hypothetical protein
MRCKEECQKNAAQLFLATIRMAGFYRKRPEGKGMMPEIAHVPNRFAASERRRSSRNSFSAGSAIHVVTGSTGLEITVE